MTKTIGINRPDYSNFNEVKKFLAESSYRGRKINRLAKKIDEGKILTTDIKFDHKTDLVTYIENGKQKSVSLKAIERKWTFARWNHKRKLSKSHTYKHRSDQRLDLIAKCIVSQIEHPKIKVPSRLADIYEMPDVRKNIRQLRKGKPDHVKKEFEKEIDIRFKKAFLFAPELYTIEFALRYIDDIKFSIVETNPIVQIKIPPFEKKYDEPSFIQKMNKLICKGVIWGWDKKEDKLTIFLAPLDNAKLESFCSMLNTGKLYHRIPSGVQMIQYNRGEMKKLEGNH